MIVCKAPESTTGNKLLPCSRLSEELVGHQDHRADFRQWCCNYDSGIFNPILILVKRKLEICMCHLRIPVIPSIETIYDLSQQRTEEVVLQYTYMPYQRLPVWSGCLRRHWRFQKQWRYEVSLWYMLIKGKITHIKLREIRIPRLPFTYTEARICRTKLTARIVRQISDAALMATRISLVT